MSTIHLTDNVKLVIERNHPVQTVTIQALENNELTNWRTKYKRAFVLDARVNPVDEMTRVAIQLKIVTQRELDAFKNLIEA